MQVVEAVAQRIRKVRASDDRRRVSAVDVVTRIHRTIAQVFATFETVGARAVRSTDPRNAYARSKRKRDARCSTRDDADDLMSGHDRSVVRLEIAFDDV